MITKDRYYLPFEMRTAQGGAEGENIVEGYAAVFERPTVLYTENGVEYCEIISRTAFAGVDLSDVVMNYNHTGKPVARTRNGSLVLTIDDTGLKVTARLGGTQEARAMYEEIKGGYIGYSSRSGKGGLILDNIALASLKKCNELGIPVGVFVYCYDTTPAAAEKTIRDVIAAIKPYKIEYPVAYDIEYGTHDGKATGYKYDKKANAANNTAIVAAALKAIEAAGYYGMIYCSRDFYLNYLEGAKLSAYDVWEAAYTSKDTAAVVNGIWQYTSTGGVPGITGNVDLDVAYKDYPAIIKTAGLNGFTASKPTTDTTPTLKTIKAGPMSAGDYKKHTAALAADGIAWEDC